MNPELGIVIAAVVSVGIGVWDLTRNDARDLLLATCLFVGGMWVGSGLHFLMPGGFLLGAAAGVALGLGRLSRVLRTRKERLERLLEGVSDDAARLLVLHDRLDSLTKSSGGLRWVYPFVAVLALIVVGTGLVVAGLRFDVSWALFWGSLTLFLPISLAERLLLEAGEQRQLGMRVTEGDRSRARVDEGKRL